MLLAFKIIWLKDNLWKQSHAVCMGLKKLGTEEHLLRTYQVSGRPGDLYHCTPLITVQSQYYYFYITNRGTGSEW